MRFLLLPLIRYCRVHCCRRLAALRFLLLPLVLSRVLLSPTCCLAFPVVACCCRDLQLAEARERAAAASEELAGRHVRLLGLAKSHAQSEQVRGKYGDWHGGEGIMVTVMGDVL